jgi:F-type H+-transporting ATPase subunit epsilon
VSVEVHVVTPERELWAGNASMVIARGVDGAVGIQAGHIPLLVRLAIGPLRVLREGEPELLAVVDGGFMHVTSSSEGATRVDVMAAHAEFVEEIDLPAARERAERLQAQLTQNDAHLAEADVAAAKDDLQKALTRISLAG